VAGPNSILYVGARPVFADVECVHHPNISPENIESKITEKTKAIQVVHYAGQPCRMELIKEIADRHKLRVIEDCAHAPGALYQGMQCGTMGDIGCFSFFSNKNLTTAEGGMIVTNNKRLARKVRLMRSHGMTTLTMDRYHGTSHSYDVVELGYNYRLDEMRSALGIVQLNRLNEVNRRRHLLAKIYGERLNACGGIAPAFADSDGDGVFHILPAVLDENVNRYDFIEDLRAKGIQTSIHYPPAHLFEIYRRRFSHGEGFLPQTEEFGRREVTLPLYPSMGEETVHHVCDAVEDFFRKGDYLK
jgi:dTDP-4-amino-4,6-dideoxygalactose transaminase